MRVVVKESVGGCSREGAVMDRAIAARVALGSWRRWLIKAKLRSLDVFAFV